MSQVRVPSWPFLFRSLAVVAKLLLERDDCHEPHTMEVQLKDPSGEKIFSTEQFTIPRGEFEPGMEYFNINLALVLSNVIFQAEGRYWFELLFDNKVIKRTPMLLKTHPGAAEPVATPEGARP